MRASFLIVSCRFDMLLYYAPQLSRRKMAPPLDERLLAFTALMQVVSQKME